MSRIVPVECKCAICGATNEYRGLASTNTLGGDPDLDSRLAEMKRSTMYVWIQECPECGYISEEVSDSSDVTIEWLQSEKYLTCDGQQCIPRRSESEYKNTLLDGSDHNEGWRGL